MLKIVIAGRNDAGKSTVLAELYKGLSAGKYQPLLIGSGAQDEKPYLMQGIDVNYLEIAIPEAGCDIVTDLDRVIKTAINRIKETNELIMHARRSADELNKVRAILELEQIKQSDLPMVKVLPDILLAEAVGINDGYRAPECRETADILLTLVPADIKNEIIMETDNVLLDEADIIVITKGDLVRKNELTSLVRLMQKIYSDKPILQIISSKGIKVQELIEVVLKLLENSSAETKK